jgi:uncharacterized membrane protein
MDFIISSTISLIIFLALDLLWLGFLARKVYRNYLGFLMAENVKWWAAILFYTLYVLVLNYFVITQFISLSDVALNGALFGFITYVTYDLTNLATVKNWPWQITLIDIIWGSVLTTIVSVLTFLIISI